MGKSLQEKLKNLKISDYIFGIFIVTSLVGIYADKKERDQYLHKDDEGLKKAHNIRLVLLTIGVLVYIYFLETRIKDRKNAVNKFLSNLDILASILFVIGGLIFLYDEFKGDEQSIIIE